MNLRTFPALLALTTAVFADERGDHADAQPSTPQDQLATFHVPPGFEVQLVAAEPEIQKPINLNFDAAGRLWVTGSELYPWPASTDPNGQPIPDFEKGRQSMIDGFKVEGAPPPASEGRDTVRILSDFDASGHAQKITVFADKLNIPSGVQPLPRGAAAIGTVYGLPSPFDPNPDMQKRGPIADRHLGKTPKGDTAIVYSIPNIWMMTDWDGDGFAESRLPLYTGFGYTDTHGGSSSYIYWLDGWIYGTHGFRNHSEVRDLNGKVTVVDSGNTYRFRPDGTAFEIFTHGQTNPFGLAFDPLGNLYSADSHSKPVYMLLRGGYYEGIGKQHDGLGFAPSITDDDHGSSAIAGIAYYADDKWPEEYRGNLFNGNPVTQKINRDRLEWHGSTPKAIRMPDFLTCDDPWFRPVNIKLGPDGALYIADFYNPIIGHYEVPLTHPARDHSHGRIWRVIYRGLSPSATSDTAPVTASNPLVFAAPDLTRLNATELTEKLADASLEIRRLATNELVDRIGAPAGKPLAALLATRMREPDPEPFTHITPWLESKPLELARTHALWAGDRIGLPPAPSSYFPNTPHSLWIDFMPDPVSEIEFVHAVRASIENLPAAEVLTKAAAEDMESFFPPPEGATVGDFAGMNKRLVNGTPWQRRTAAEFLGAGADPSYRCLAYLTNELSKVPVDDVELLYQLRRSLCAQLAQPDRFRYARWFEEKHPTSGALLADISLGIPSADSADFLLAHLATTELQDPHAGEYLKHAALNLPKERFEAAAGLLSKAGDLPIGQRLALADAISAAAKERSLTLSPETTAWTQKAMLEALESPDDALARKAMDAIETVKLYAKLEPLTRIAQDEKRDVAVRADALSAAANLPTSRALLTAALADRSQMKICRRAGKLLVQNEGSDVAIAALPQAPWELALTISDALARTDAGALALLDVIEAGKVPRRVLQDKSIAGAFFSRPQATRDRAKELTKDLPPEDERLDKLITARAEAFLKAQPDATRGAQVFQQNCAVCHRLHNEGGNVGPNLDGVVARGAQRLTEDILDPNRNVDPGFRQTIIETTDGQMFAGANVRDQGEAVLLTDATGKELSVPVSTIKTRTQSALSLMPPIFETQIAPEDFNDLLGYLLGGVK